MRHLSHRKIAPVEVTLGNLEAENIQYTENRTGYTGKGVMLGNTNLNRYNAEVPEVGAYSFTFKDGVINRLRSQINRFLEMALTP